jgi:glycogen debranching enzyme
MTRSNLRAAAEALLRQNDRNGCTVPAAKLYPHQWNWDSAFCAMGWAYFDPRRAVRELEMLVRGQWGSGMIPHIIFNPEAVNYEPSPKVWKIDGAPGRPEGVDTSSITQPPVLATAARFVLEKSGGDKEIEEALRRIVAAADKWHAWFLRDRDPLGLGMTAVVHPWESGLDNAPRWDDALRRIEPGEVTYKRKDDTVVNADQRPTRFDYDRYFFLVEERARLGFAPPKPKEVSFLVADVAMASILCRAEEDLHALALALGAEAPQALARREKLIGGIGRLYDAEKHYYHDHDLVSGEPIAFDHVAGFLPLFAHVVPEAVVPAMVARLKDPAKFGTKWPVPSVGASDPKFDPRRYWRGPTWINVNWMLIEGLRHAGQHDYANGLAARSIELVERSGFREYYEPSNGEGLGAEDFSWTAALLLDLLATT